MLKATPNYVASIPKISSKEIQSGLSDNHPPSHVNPLVVTRLFTSKHFTSLMKNTIYYVVTYILSL